MKTGDNGPPGQGGRGAHGGLRATAGWAQCLCVRHWQGYTRLGEGCGWREAVG
jgi:hypothetical protein